MLRRTLRVTPRVVGVRTPPRCGGASPALWRLFPRQMSGDTKEKPPIDPKDMQPLTKLFYTLRNAWKLHKSTDSSLAARLEARKKATEELQAKHKFAADRATKLIAEKVGGSMNYMMHTEMEKLEAKRKLIEEKLAHVKLDPHKIEQRVTKDLLEKWETALSGGGGGSRGGSGGPSGTSSGGSSGG